MNESYSRYKITEICLTIWKTWRIMKSFESFWIKLHIALHFLLARKGFWLWFLDDNNNTVSNCEITKPVIKSKNVRYEIGHNHHAQNDYKLAICRHQWNLLIVRSHLNQLRKLISIPSLNFSNFFRSFHFLSLNLRTK